MISTLIWAGVVLVLGGVAIWRAERYLKPYFESRIKAVEAEGRDDETAMMERRTAAEIASRTVDQATALEQAKLEHKTAEINASTALIDELKPERIAAERAIIEARVEAERELAPEFAREAHKGNEGDVIDMYKRYVKACPSLSPMGLTSFIDTLRRTNQI